MENLSVATPFGRRAMTLGMLASQMSSRKIEPDKSVDKWKLFRALCEAKPLLDVTDRALAVLNALLSFYPRSELSNATSLVVFPSNAQLSLRTHGMAEQTIRRHLAALIAAGLLIRKDSPNGKRYAHKARNGDIRDAFGFSLSPLLARAEEIEELAAYVATERLQIQQLRERITLCRRDITKLVATAIDTDPAGNWDGILDSMRAALSSLPRVPQRLELETTADVLEALRENVITRLELFIKTQNKSANPCQIERHIQSSDSESFIEVEQAFRKPRNEKTTHIPWSTRATAGPNEQKHQSAAKNNRQPTLHTIPAPPRTFPLELVLQACPQISAYTRGGIHSHRDLLVAASIVRTTLGVSASAFEEACTVLGPYNAATLMACILERGDRINSPGAYLRDLTRRASLHEFAIAPMLMALRRPKVMPRKNG